MTTDQPASQYLAPEYVIHEMCKQVRSYTHDYSLPRIAILAILGGAFVALGALLSILLSTGVETRGLQLFLAVTLFVAGNFQHSPANMGYFSMIMPTGQGPGWPAALAWNIVPAGIGNILGGTLLVALPLRYSLRPHSAS